MTFIQWIKQSLINHLVEFILFRTSSDNLARRRQTEKQKTEEDTESGCCTVLLQIPLWACQNLILWSYPAVARITGSPPPFAIIAVVIKLQIDYIL